MRPRRAQQRLVEQVRRVLQPGTHPTHRVTAATPFSPCAFTVPACALSLLV
jgi:hypothetical protein